MNASRRRSSRRRRVQRIDKPDSTDTRLGVRSPLHVGHPAAGTRHAATVAKQAAARRTTSGKGGQLVGERGGIAPEVVTSAFVQKGAQCRPNVDEGVS